MKVANNLVVDAYGGYYGKPSPYLPAKSTAATATATTNTTNTTANATNTTTNTTAAKTRVLAAQTNWVINVFVQPSPTADAVSNSEW